MKDAPTFTNYADAAEHQLREWAEGRPWHNPWAPGASSPKHGRGEGECCPDFSCCRPDMIWAKERRYAFVAAGREGRERMLFGSLSSLGADINASVIGGKDGGIND